MKEVKQQLYDYCQFWVDQRIKEARQAIESAQTASNEATKSSAGDKYETTRAMAQLEVENNSIQLSEALKLSRSLGSFTATTTSEIIGSGSLVETDRGWYYLSVSAGKVLIGGVSYICLSPVSPLGSRLTKSGIGDNFNFNGQSYSIINVH